MYMQLLESSIEKPLSWYRFIGWNMHFNKPLADVYITTYSLGLEHALQ